MVSTSASLSLWSVSWLLIAPASCGSIAAWYNTRGPSLLMQDDETGGIRYSLCNGNYTPIFPDDKTLTLPLTSHPPKNNTSLSATGWTDGETAWASIFYLDNDDEIINTLLECNWGSGTWKNTGDYMISGNAPKVAPDSGLAAVLLGATDGYRVFYNDLEGIMHYLGYTSSTQQWDYYGVVSQDAVSSQAISATFSTQNQNISIVRPRDNKNMGVSRWHDDDMWHVSAFPQPLTLTGNQSTNATDQDDLHLDPVVTDFSLTSWDGNASTLGIGIDSSYTRYIFYIGTDKKIYQLHNDNSTWVPTDRPSDEAWPDADVAGGNFGIASDFTSSTMRLYYMSGGQMIEANGDNGNWQAATVLATTNDTQAATSTSSGVPAATSSPSDSDGGGGLSNGAKAGISAGVTLGVIAVVGMLSAFIFLRRRQKQYDADVAAGVIPGPGTGGDGNDMYMSPSTVHTYPATSSHMGSPTDLAMATAGTGYDGTLYTPAQGVPPVPGYPTHNMGYPQQQQQQQGTAGYVDPNYAQYGAYHQGQPPYAQGGGWAHATAGQQQQDMYGYPNQQQQQHPQEMPSQTKPVEMMGEGHYKEAP
ncbi:hypothetical protein F4778DRAFT_783865 [Xylariomycetidae sp. FL2044]|nr:hypothetical protein F4778DRAFT_783865 [Xylariomycetidae sp. FL2044]